MDEHGWLAERFEDDRIGLRAVAYRMLGPVSQADDAVQPERNSELDLTGLQLDGPTRKGGTDGTRTGRPEVDRPVR